MTTDLVQRLRTCHAQERRTVAMELAKVGSEEVITELKRMVEGKHRKGLRWYNYADQLVGIEALKVTGTSKALEFLSKVYSSLWSYETGESFCTSPMQGSGDLPSYESVRIDSFRFPWARKKLGSRLAYSVELNEHRVEGYSLPYRPKEEIEAELREIFAREPHSIIQGAIKELEISTGQKLQIVTIDSGIYYNSHNKEQLVDEYFQCKHEGSCQIAERHSPQVFLRS